MYVITTFRMKKKGGYKGEPRRRVAFALQG